ncbi:MAG: transcriptional repressor [Bdellovibrionales bacterium]|nr:transcriptional repressor [Bdellovibrionales bacterium]
MSRRNTVQKSTILKNLQERCDHPSALDVYHSIKSELPQVSLATVYRNLEDLSQQGKVRKLDTLDDITRFDGNISPHSHVICSHCGAIEDIAPVNSDLMLKEAQKNSLFAIREIEFVFSGLCPNCHISN